MEIGIYHQVPKIKDMLKIFDVTKFKAPNKMKEGDGASPV
jgi:hypothetical protein